MEASPDVMTITETAPMNDTDRFLDTVPPAKPPRQHGALADFRQMAMTTDTTTMQRGLAEYKERRDCFMSWLKDQLTEGVHYGVPPGCEPMGKVDPRQWQARPSLYKAGAALVADLMGLRAEYTADEAAWRQLGGKDGTFVLVCRLVSKATGETIGEGRGAFAVGEKKMGSNSALKMCEKRALVDAILNAYALSDLNCQDLEDPDYAIPQYDNPRHNRTAPRAAPRSERSEAGQVSAQQVGDAINDWKSQRHEAEATPAHWSDWVQRVAGRQFNVRSSHEWTKRDLEKVSDALMNNIA